MKPYSNDFRTKIIETKYKTHQSIKQLAKRFQVSYSMVQKLLKRYEATGSVEPSPHGGGKPPKLTSEKREIVLELVEEDNDATLQQLCARLFAKTKIKVSVPTMCRILQKLELTRKKAVRPRVGVRRLPRGVIWARERAPRQRLSTPLKLNQKGCKS